MKKAIELNKEYYLELAKQDKDFEDIRNDERFKALIKNYVEERGNKNIKWYTSDGKPVSIGKQR